MEELMIPLESGSKIPVYEQICRYLKREIQSGKIEAGEKLPSARGLAKNLCVSRSTIDMSYDQLVSEGYIESVPCKGYYVCKIDGLYYAEDAIKKNKVAENLKQQEKSVEFLYDFALNGIAPGGFPYNIWKKLFRQVFSGEDESILCLGDPLGEEGVRREVAKYLYQARGVSCSWQQVILGAGNDYLLMLLSTILGKDRKIAMENPTYPNAYYDFIHMGYEVETVPVDSQGISVKSLEHTNADTVYVMPSHQFPMGVIMPLKRRTELLNWAYKKQDRYIIEDDYDSEFRYKGRPIPALQGFDRQGKVIYLGTFSKSLAPSVRISYMVLPPGLMEKYLAMKPLFSVTVSGTDQKILELFLREGYYEKHLNRMRAVYKNKHDILLKILREMEDICRYSGEYAGVHMLVKFKNGMSEREAIERAERCGIKIYGLSQYQIAGEEVPEKGVLLGYACMTEEELYLAGQKLKEAWKDY